MKWSELVPGDPGEEEEQTPLRKMRKPADYRRQAKPLLRKKSFWKEHRGPAQRCDYVPNGAFSDPINLTRRPHKSC